MPKSYSEKERTLITDALKAAAFKSMIESGIKKTTIDDLVEKVKIPKGTFYLFYKSKEALLFEAIMQKEEELHTLMATRIASIKEDFSISSLTDLLYDFFVMAFSMGILPIMLSGELDILIRRLPDDVVAQSISKDNDFAGVLQGLFPKINDSELNVYSSAFRALFFTASYKREIGEYEEALKLLIKGLVMQMWEAKNDKNQ